MTLYIKDDQKVLKKGGGGGIIGINLKEKDMFLNVF